MTKTNQKIDNNICKALTLACEYSLHKIPGFSWLTHRANYTNFPSSLIVTCIFETEAEIEEMKTQQFDGELRSTIQKQLLNVGVVVKNIKQQVRFDSEEACLSQSGGEWPQRLALSIAKQKAHSIKNKR